MTVEASTKPRRWLRRVLQGAVLLLAGLVIWYGQNRLRAPGHAVLNYQFGTTSARQFNTDTDMLTLGCFNIAHSRGTNASNWSDREYRDMRLVQLARLLRDQRLDVVVLNEVDFDSQWSGHENQARIIAEFAGFEHVLEQRNLDVALPFFRLRFGNAILSHYPITSAQAIAYPALSAAEHWLAGSKQGVWADISLNSTNRIRVVAVHLEHRDAATRERSAEALLQQAREATVPVFCLGDFNTTRLVFRAAKEGKGSGATIEVMLKSGLFQTAPMAEPAPEEFTFPSYAPDRTIDWIMIPARWQIVSQRVVPTDLSDHRLVVMQVRKGN